MIIDVTQVDIDAGVKLSCSRCPVARAIRRATGDRYASVGEPTAHVLGRVVRLPMAVRQFIFDFDAGLIVSPFSFELDVRA